MQSEDRVCSLKTGCAVLGQGVQYEDKECSLRIGSAVLGQGMRTGCAV